VTVAGGRQPERRRERAGEVRLVGESGLARDVGQRPTLVHLDAREVETAHEEIAMGTGAERDPELTAQVIAGEPGDRLQLR
jgi:hypothetical protein